MKTATKRKKAVVSRGRKAAGGAAKKKGVQIPEVRIGEKVRQLRKKKGLSIQKLAELSGVSPAGIYKIETNGMVPTITTLVKLATALEHRVSYFVEEEEALPDLRFIRKNERMVLASGQEGKSELVAERLRLGRLEGVYRTLEPGSRSRNPITQPGGEQLIYCLKGEVTVCRGDEDYALKEGDTLHHQVKGPIRIENTGRSQSHVLIVHAPLSAG